MQIFHFLDGRQKQIPCYSSTNAAEALEFLVGMIGLRDPAGYMIYEVFKKVNIRTKKEEIVGQYLGLLIDRFPSTSANSSYNFFLITERSLMFNEILGDSLSKFYQFEQAFKVAGVPLAGDDVKAYMLVKRKLFLNARQVTDDRNENLLMFHQVRKRKNTQWKINNLLDFT